MFSLVQCSTSAYVIVRAFAAFQKACVSEQDNRPLKMAGQELALVREHSSTGTWPLSRGAIPFRRQGSGGEALLRAR
jgi:hypothetical protein